MPEHLTVPIPDPTSLTTEQLHREINALRELLEAQIAAAAEITLERFRGIETQFNERDKRTEQTARDSKVAVDAAFSAAKEAVAEQNKSSALAIAKSEAGTTKQIDQIQQLIGTIREALEGKINDVKERIGKGDGRSEGANAVWGYVCGAGGLIIAVVAVAEMLMRGQ